MARATGIDGGRARAARTAAWLALVAAAACWAALAYQGLAGAIGEWEYRRLGRHLPILTPLLLIAPPALLLARLRPRGRRDARAAERRLLGLLQCMAALCVLAAALMIGRALAMPAAPGDGPARLTGRVIATRTVTFRRALPFLHHAVRFAPVEARDGAIRYFVEMTPDRIEAARDGAPALYKGMLARDALPDAVARLFGHAGLPVARPHYVLFASRGAMLAPYHMAAANWLLAALTALLLALLQQWRLARRARAA